jgi:hypothetical protein
VACPLFASTEWLGFLMVIRITFIAAQPGVFSGIRLILALQN